jgi:hypothetical protein
MKKVNKSLTNYIGYERRRFFAKMGFVKYL